MGPSAWQSHTRCNMIVKEYSKSSHQDLFLSFVFTDSYLLTVPHYPLRPEMGWVGAGGEAIQLECLITFLVALGFHSALAD